MSGAVEIYAHRGGALYPPNVGIENTLRAFRNAADLGVRWMETDVHASSDGVVFATHDPDLSRLGGRGDAISRLSSGALADVRIGGREPLPRLVDLLDGLPEAFFNIDMKSDAVVAPLVRLLRSTGHERVRLASFDTARLARVRRALPGVRTSTSTREVVMILSGLTRRRRGTLDFPNIDCVQIPYRLRGVPVATRRNVDLFHARGYEVHVWTVNEEDDFRRLLSFGVDAIVTDRPDRLARLLHDGKATRTVQ